MPSAEPTLVSAGMCVLSSGTFRLPTLTALFRPLQYEGVSVDASEHLSTYFIFLPGLSESTLRFALNCLILFSPF